MTMELPKDSIKRYLSCFCEYNSFLLECGFVFNLEFKNIFVTCTKFKELLMQVLEAEAPVSGKISIEEYEKQRIAYTQQELHKLREFLRY